MKITSGHVVEIEYTLTNDKGDVLDSSKGREPLAYLHGSKNIIPGLEKELEGRAKGDELKVTVEPAEGYGERNDEAIQEVPRDALANIEGLKAGAQLQADTPEGTRIFTVTEVQDDKVTLDGNHPLAGERLNFDVQVVGVREASPEEKAHGHVHGAGGHAH